MAVDALSLIGLLQLSPSHRTLEIVSKISESVTGLKFFREQSEDVRMACCKVMRGQLHRRHEVIFNYGDQGHSFYIILKGFVKVLVPLQPTGVNRKPPYGKLLRWVDGDEVTPLREVAELQTGDCFGELALLQAEVRSATIQCKGQVFLACINKDDYNRVLRIQQQRKLLHKIKFFKATAAFSGFGEMQLAKLVYFFHEKQYMRGTVVYRKGDLSTYVYIISTGEFIFSDSQFIPSNTESEESGSMKKKTKDVQVFSKAAQEMFGHEELFQGCSRLYTCTCATVDGLVYYMAKEEFLKWCQSESTQKYLGQYEVTKAAWLNKRIPSIQKGEQAKLSMSMTVLPHVQRPCSPVQGRVLLKQLLVSSAAVGKARMRKQAADRLNASDVGRSLLRTRSSLLG